MIKHLFDFVNPNFYDSLISSLRYCRIISRSTFSASAVVDSRIFIRLPVKLHFFTVVLPAMVTYLVIAVMFSKGNIREAMNVLKITEDTAAASLPSVQAAASFNYGLMALNVFERLAAMFIHIGLTVIVFYGVVTAKKAFLPLAILLHMLADTFPALYQRGVLPLWSVEVWAALWAVIITLIALRLYKKLS